MINFQSATTTNIKDPIIKVLSFIWDNKYFKKTLTC